MMLHSQNDWIRRSLFTNQIELLAAFNLKYQLSFNILEMTKSLDGNPSEQCAVDDITDGITKITYTTIIESVVNILANYHND